MRIIYTGLKLTALIAILFMPLLAAENAASAPKKGATGQKSAGAEKPTIVLIHGAFADGSSWREVVPILQSSGYKVVAAQMPLKSYDDDVATAKAVIGNQKGDVVVVGHSYGGAVITEAAANNPKVKALVYVSAFAPDSGETLKGNQDKFAKMPLASALVPDANGFLYIEQEKFHDNFAQDVSKKDAMVLAAVQKPIASASFGASPKAVAWRKIPSWSVITSEDRAIDPNQERAEAKRMSAHVTEIKAGHLSMLTKPKDVAKVIESAAKEQMAMGNPE